MIDVSTLQGLAVVTVLGAFIFMAAWRRLFKCPECGHRNDYDHIAEVNEDRPYCPYCGTETVQVGRKYQAWSKRLGLPNDFDEAREMPTDAGGDDR